MPGVEFLDSPRACMERFGDRIMDTPITESAFIGAAAGAAACGMRPVAELMFIDFMGVCFDQIFNQAAKFKYMFGGKAETPGCADNDWRRVYEQLLSTLSVSIRSLHIFRD